MKTFGFKPPHERVEPRLWTAENSLLNVNAGKFTRNSVLGGATIGDAPLPHSWLKSRDVVSHLIGAWDRNNNPITVWGGHNASNDIAATRGILRPDNIAVWWTPGGNGIGSWVSVRLPESTLVETYGVGTKSASTPLSWILQGSMDGTVWADLHTVENTGVWNATYEFKEFIVPEETRGAYLYYRLYITGSNAATMSLRNFRLFRPVGVCGKGQLLVDASSLRPLLLSYADGFDGDGITPVDITESISMPIATGMFDADGYPAMYQASNINPFKVNLYAVRNSAGNVTIEAELGSGGEKTQAAGGMTAQISNGWECTSTNSAWWSNFGRVGTRTIPPVTSDVRFLKTNAPNGVYVSRIYCPLLSYGSSYTRIPVYVIEMDDSLTEINSSYTFTVNIERRIKGIKTSMPSSSSARFDGFALYSPAAPFYRMSGGKLYSKDGTNGIWTPCHKIYIGSCTVDQGSGEVFDPEPYAAFDMMSMVNGNVDTDISG